MVLVCVLEGVFFPTPEWVGWDAKQLITNFSLSTPKQIKQACSDVNSTIPNPFCVGDRSCNACFTGNQSKKTVKSFKNLFCVAEGFS